MTYTTEQAAANFKVGDIVVVTRAAHDRENGWQNVWCNQMIVGDIHTVTNTHPLSGISLSDGYAYPYFVLKKVGEETLPPNIKIGSVLINKEYPNATHVIESIGINKCLCRISFFDEPVHNTLWINFHKLIHDYEVIKS